MRNKSTPLEAARARSVPLPLTGSTPPKFLVIAGPTASGKSDLAIKLARKFNGEIISADSRQIYRGMDIGTAKPPFGVISKSEFLISKQISSAKSPAYAKASAGKQTPKFYKGVPHYLVDIKNPDQHYTVAEYKQGAIKIIRNILRRGKLPILVGGTGLYIKAVVENLEIPRVPTNPKLREKLDAKLKKYGLAKLYDKLIKLDPEAAGFVDSRNPRRVIRALEVALRTGKPFSIQRKKGAPLFDALILGLKISPKKLRERINRRVDAMIRSGLVEEARGLVKKYEAASMLMNTIGYKEVIASLDGKISLAEAVRQIKLTSWQYARRQMTWFRKDKYIKRIPDFETARKLTAKFLKS